MIKWNVYTSERIYWAVEQVEKEVGDIEDLHLDDNLFYLKSDVEKTITDLEAENLQLKKQSSCAFGDDCLRVRQLEREVRNSKYKRCLDKAAYWLAVSYNCINYKHQRNAEKNHYRWLDLAVKFKEVK